MFILSWIFSLFKYGKEIKIIRFIRIDLLINFFFKNHLKEVSN